MLCITESLLDETVLNNEISLSYCLLRNDRSRNGGTAIYIHSTVNFKHSELLFCPTHCGVLLNRQSCPYRICIYRDKLLDNLDAALYDNDDVVV